MNQPVRGAENFDWSHQIEFLNGRYCQKNNSPRFRRHNSSCNGQGTRTREWQKSSEIWREQYVRRLYHRIVIDLRGQTAVVTGASRGLGRAFASALAAAGASVTILARSIDELNRTAASIGPNVQAFPADVTDVESVAESFRRIGPVDLLVNNAGVLGPIGPFATADFDAWWQTLNVNFRGAMLCARAVLPEMIERGHGRVINIVTGAVSMPYLSPYMASKTALVCATESLAAETKPRGVALFSVGPGTIRTDMATYSLTSDEGRRWIPWFRRIFDEGLDVPSEQPAALIVTLASGKYDALTGLYLTCLDDLDAMVAGIAQIEQDKLHALQIRPFHVSKASAALACIREAGGRARL